MDLDVGSPLDIWEMMGMAVRKKGQEEQNGVEPPDLFRHMWDVGAAEVLVLLVVRVKYETQFQLALEWDAGQA